MKIEIGESIIFSWLKHIKKCQIVQLNWKTSPEWKQDASNNSLQEIMDRANIEFNNPFKKTKDLSQLFRQAEIDAVGIDLQGNTVYAVDIAFHEGGLSYGDKFETAKRITKKIIRTILILQQHFKNTMHHEIVFVSPKINPEPLLILKSEIERVSSFITKESISCKIRLISNDDFNDEILKPITHISKNVADTSELFLRGIQLARMFEPSIPVIIEDPSPPFIRPKIKNSNENLSEINKVERKIPGWFRAPNQINSTILLSYMELAEHKVNVTEQMIRNNCPTLSDFKGNFNQMKNFGEKNHAKVFEEKFGYINLWEPVKEFIIGEYIVYKKGITKI